MRANRLFMLISAFLLLGSATVFGDTLAKYKFDTVKVTVNGQGTSVEGVMIDGRTYLPLRDTTNALQAIVHWEQDSRTAHIYKPNVHMMLLEMHKGKTTGQLFGKAPTGNNVEFLLHTQVDNLKTEIQYLRIQIIDPVGTEVYSYEEELNGKKDTFWHSRVISQEFAAKGSYTVRASFKERNGADYQTVSERIIISE